jgi:uncharacterized protein
VFAELAKLARVTADGGHAVIADTTFIDLHHRPMIEDAAAAAGVPFVGLWLEAPLPMLEARIAARRDDASDATVAVLRSARSGNPQAGRWVVVNASDADTALAQARAAVHRVVMRGRLVSC